MQFFKPAINAMRFFLPYGALFLLSSGVLAGVLPIEMEAKILGHLQNNDLAKHEYNPWLKTKASSGNPDVLFTQRVSGATWRTDQLPASLEVDLGKPFQVGAVYVEDPIWRDHGAGEYEILVYDDEAGEFVQTHPRAYFNMTVPMNGHRKVLSFDPVVTDKIKLVAMQGRGSQPETFFLNQFSVLSELTEELKFYQDFLIANYETAPTTDEWIGKWIWDRDVQAQTVTFRKDFEIEGEIDSADLQVNAKNWLNVEINGVSLYRGNGSPTLSFRNIEEYLQSGRNRITVRVVNHQWPGGLMLEALIRLSDGNRIVLATDESWQSSTVPNQWSTARYLTQDIYGRWRNLPVFDFSRPEIIVSAVEMLPQVAAGDLCTARLEIVPTEDLRLPDEVTVSLIDADGVTVVESEAKRIEVVDRQKIEIEFSPSRYLLPGKYTVALKGFTYPGNEIDGIGVLEVLPPQIPIENIDVQVRKGKNGQPGLFINEEPVYPAFYYYYNSMDEARKMHDAGMGLYVVSTARISTGYWTGYGEYDLVAYEKLLHEILEMDPNAYLMLQIGVDLYMSWWTKQNPEERALLSDGELVPSYASRSADSFASEVGLEDTKQFVHDIVAHFENSPFKERIVGYRFMKGGGGEWYMWYPKHVNSFLLVPPFADHSKPMVRAFQNYLRDKYDSVENLAEAWGMKVADFGSVKIPADETITSSGYGVFRDLQQEQPIVDYFEAVSDVNVNYIETLLRSARDASEGKKFLNVFYGYTYEFWEPRQVFSGHMALNRLLSSGLLDSISAPHAYFNRYVGQSGALMQPVDSIRSQGVLYFDDSDFRTHLSTINYPHEYLPQDSVSVMWRNFMMMLQKNFAYQWHPFGEWFSSPEIQSAVSQMSDLGERLIAEENASEASLLVPEQDRIAIVVSEKAPFVMGLETSPKLAYYLITIQREVFPSIGAPFDMLLLEELLEREEVDYKAYVFLNAFSLTEKQRKVIKDKLQRDGNVLAWVYAPGIYKDQDFGAEHMESITGISLQIDHSEGPLQVRISDTDHTVTAFSSEGEVFGNRGEAVSPRVYSDDEDAITLGVTLPENRSGIAVKDMGDWTSVFIAAPRLSASLLRGIAKLAGVHLYTDQDLALYPNQRYLGIYPDRYQSTVIRFPDEVRLFDLMKNEWVGDEFSATHQLDLLTNQPYLYQLHYEQ